MNVRQRLRASSPARARPSGGASVPAAPPVALVPQVDLPPFVGDRSVIADTSTRREKDSHDARDSDHVGGAIATAPGVNADTDDGPASHARRHQ